MILIGAGLALMFRQTRHLLRVPKQERPMQDLQTTKKFVEHYMYVNVASSADLRSFFIALLC